MKFNRYSVFFMALANQGRMKTIMALRQGPKSVGHLVEAVGLQQSHVSHHLKCLSFCGFVKNRRQGKKRIYSLNAETLQPLLKLVEQHVRKYASHLGRCEVLEY